jgi:endonuclease/exonuclease/phosphatase family metal-dependent hydrolase
LRVITFNIRDGGITRETRIREILLTLQPDLLFIQEVVDPDVILDLAQTLHMTPVLASGWTKRRVALLTRFPVISQRSHSPFPKLSRDFLEVTVEYRPQQPIRLFAVHLAAQPFALFELWRLMEISAVLRCASTDPSMPCLIAGDFNAVAPDDSVITNSLPFRLKLMLFLQGNRFFRRVISKVMFTGFVDCYRILHADPGFTLPPPNPTIRFDYLFANPTLRSALRDCFVVRQPASVDDASDHYPVVADFDV